MPSCLFSQLFLFSLPPGGPLRTHSISSRCFSSSPRCVSLQYKTIVIQYEPLHTVKVTLEGLGNRDIETLPLDPLPLQSFGPLSAPLFLFLPASVLPPSPSSSFSTAPPLPPMQITPSPLSLSLTQRASLSLAHPSAEKL